MTTILAVNHDVADYDAWKRVFDEYHETDRGMTFYRINRNVDDPNNITVVHGFESVDAARGFVEDPELAEAMGRAGATSAPRIEIYDEVESATR